MVLSSQNEQLFLLTVLPRYVVAELESLALLAIHPYFNIRNPTTKRHIFPELQ